MKRLLAAVAVLTLTLSASGAAGTPVIILGALPCASIELRLMADGPDHLLFPEAARERLRVSYRAALEAGDRDRAELTVAEEEQIVILHFALDECRRAQRTGRSFRP